MRLAAVDLDRLQARLRRFAHVLAASGVVVLLLQAFSIVLDAAARGVLDAPIFGLEDINELLIAVTLASFMPALFIERGNITITLLGRMLPRRIDAWLHVFGQCLALVFLVVLVWQYADYAVDLGPTHTIILELRRSPFAWAVTLLLLVAACLQLLVVLHAVARATSPAVSPRAARAPEPSAGGRESQREASR